MVVSGVAVGVSVSGAGVVSCEGVVESGADTSVVEGATVSAGGASCAKAGARGVMKNKKASTRLVILEKVCKAEWEVVANKKWLFMPRL